MPTAEYSSAREDLLHVAVGDEVAHGGAPVAGHDDAAVEGQRDDRRAVRRLERAPRAAAAGREGSSSGAWAPTNSVNERRPGRRNCGGQACSAGERPVPGSLAALLDEAAHELLGVGLRARRRSRRGRCRCRRRGRPCGPRPRRAVAGSGRLVAAPRRDAAVGSAPGSASVLHGLGQACRPSCAASLVDTSARCRVPTHATARSASGLRSSSAPTVARVPRSGSSIGTRCRVACPGTSKITESQDAAAISVGELLQAAAAEPRPGVLRRRRRRPLSTVLVADQLLEPAAAAQPVEQPLLGAHVGPLDVDGAQPVVVPARGRRGRGSPRAAAAWRPSRPRGAHSIGSRSEPVRTSPQQPHDLGGVGVGLAAAAGRAQAAARLVVHPRAARSAVIVRPSTSSTLACSVGSCETVVQGRDRPARRPGPR